MLRRQKIQLLGAPVGKFHQQRQLAIVIRGERNAHVLAPYLDRVCRVGWRCALRGYHGHPAKNQGRAKAQCRR
jgi:hypothetical protein